MSLKFFLILFLLIKINQLIIINKIFFLISSGSYQCIKIMVITLPSLNNNHLKTHFIKHILNQHCLDCNLIILIFKAMQHQINYDVINKSRLIAEKVILVLLLIFKINNQNFIKYHCFTICLSYYYEFLLIILMVIALSY